MACRHWNLRPWWRAFTRMPDGNCVLTFHNRLDPITREDRLTAITDFLHSDEAKGLYVCRTHWPPGKESVTIDEIGGRYCFTDPNTAFAFKMRFYEG